MEKFLLENQWDHLPEISGLTSSAKIDGPDDLEAIQRAMSSKGPSNPNQARGRSKRLKAKVPHEHKMMVAPSRGGGRNKRGKLIGKILYEAQRMSYLMKQAMEAKEKHEALLKQIATKREKEEIMKVEQARKKRDEAEGICQKEAEVEGLRLCIQSMKNLREERKFQLQALKGK
jgi:hypothetical protein